MTLPRLAIISAAICASLSLSGCGLSSLTSGLSGGMFGKQSSTPVQDVTEEQLLSAAKAHNNQTVAATSSVDVAHGCPRFKVWPRDSAVTEYENGLVGDALAVVYRGEITRTARELSLIHI